MASKIYDAEMQILTVSFAKGIGLKDRGKVDSFDELAGSHADDGLSPLLVYSLVAPACRSYFRLLVDPANPVPLSQFLHDAWSPRMAWGMPLTLQVKASLLASDRGFASWVEQQGIELQLHRRPSPSTHLSGCRATYSGLAAGLPSPAVSIWTGCRTRSRSATWGWLRTTRMTHSPC